MPTPSSLFHRIACTLIDEGSFGGFQYADCPPSSDPDDNRSDFTLKILRNQSCVGYLVFRIAVARQDSVNTLAKVKVMDRNYTLRYTIKFEGNHPTNNSDYEDVLFNYIREINTQVRGHLR